MKSPCLAVLALLLSGAAMAQTPQLSDLELTGAATRYIFVDTPTAAGPGNNLTITAGPANGANAGGSVFIGGGNGSFAFGNVLLSTAGGFVGIGTASPTQAMDVVGNFKFSQALMPGNNAGAAGQFLLSQGPNTAQQWTNTFGSTVVFTGPVSVGPSGSLTLNGSSITLAGAAAIAGQSSITASGFFGDGSHLTFPPATVQVPSVLLSSVTTSASQACVTVTVPPATYLTLRFFSPSQSAADLPYIQFNGDTGANYSYECVTDWGESTTTGVAANYIQMNDVVGNSNQKGPHQLMIDILADRADEIKSVSALGTAGCDVVAAVGDMMGGVGFWLNTTSQINLATICNVGGATFAAGTVFEVFGGN